MCHDKLWRPRHMIDEFRGQKTEKGKSPIENESMSIYEIVLTLR